MKMRGQGVVEMCLGLLVFITVLIFGIHFAEVGYLALKASEAASRATWDATGMRAHRFGPGGSTFLNSNQMTKGFPAQNAAALADSAYRDFDGRSSTNQGATLAQVFTRARNLAVSCRPAAVATFDGYVTNPGNIESVFSFPQDGAGARVDGQGCNASSMLEGFNIPRSFMEKPGNGYFKVKHYEDVGIKVCSIGRPRGPGGACEGRLSLALGDWGFAGGNTGTPPSSEWEDCNPTSAGGCNNGGYWRAVETLYTMNGASAGTASSMLAAYVSGGASPTNEETFHMMFRGEDTGAGKEMHHELTDETGALVKWEVTPSREGSGYEASWNVRQQCFLGMPCAGGVF